MINYSNKSKAKHLGISQDYIRKYGAVSRRWRREWPKESKNLQYDIRIVHHRSGGPTGGTKRSPLGRVFIGLAARRKVWVKKLDLKGSRREIKRKATRRAPVFL